MVESSDPSTAYQMDTKFSHLFVVKIVLGFEKIEI